MRHRPGAALVAALLLSAPTVASEPEAPGADLAWRGNSLGRTDTVPAPWTAVEVEGGVARVWGRELRWGTSPLPDQILSQGRPLLAAPLELRLVTPEGARTFGGEPARVTAHEPTHAVFEHRGEAGDLELATTATLEFDGMLRVEMVLSPKAPTRVESLHLTLPVAREVGRVMSRHLEYDFKRRRTNKTDYERSMIEVRERIDLPFNPEIWLGNREVGIVWAAETNAQWDVADGERALSVIPGAERTELVVRLIDHPVTLEAPRRFEFALFPTPLKPVAPRLGRLRLASAGRFKAAFDAGVESDATANYTIATSRNEVHAPYESLPWSDGSLAHQKVRSRLREVGVQYIPYGALLYTNAFHPVGRRFYEEWHVEPVGPSTRARWKRYDLGASRDLEVAAGRHWDGYRVCPAAESYANFVVWAWIDAIRKEDLDGIYFDHGDPSHSCRNQSHDHFDAAEGPQRKLFFGLFGVREILKRLWIAGKATQPDLLIVQHQSTTLKSLGSFADVVVTGEVMNAVFAGRPTSSAVRKDPTLYVPDYDRVPDAALDYGYLDSLGFEGRMLPQVKYAIPDYWRRHPERYRFYSDKMLRHTLLRGIGLWAGNMAQETLVDAWRALDRMRPLDEAEFRPYWEPQPGLETGAPDTLLAHYRRPGRVLLIVGNPSSESREETIRVSAPHNYDEALDATDGERVPFDGERLRLTVPSERYRAILLTE